MDWFTVDKQGLAKLIERRGKAFALFELVQNVWDTEALVCQVIVEPLPNKPYATIEVVDDDPDGFKNLSHAFTLFAESDKKADPEKRGRFNLGEKLVLALCEEAEIQTTTGTVRFDKDGRHVLRRRGREKGSRFVGTIRMTRAEYDDVCRAMRSLIPPARCTTFFNGESLDPTDVHSVFEATLPTETADADGYLRRKERKATVTVHHKRSDEQATLYEMGIPVVALTGGERFHVNVHQKIPLNSDRENVTPAYLQTLRVLVANALGPELTADDAASAWLINATDDHRVEPSVVAKLLDERFGKKRAIYDPSDPEANKQLMNEGYTVIHGGSLLAGQWVNVKQHGLAEPAGRIRPTGMRYDPEGEPENVIAPGDWTRAQSDLARFSRELSRLLIQITVAIKLVDEPTRVPHLAWYNKAEHLLTINVGRIGSAEIDIALLELLLHEFAHEAVDDHLTREFADEVARLGVKFALLAHRSAPGLRALLNEVS